MIPYSLFNERYNLNLRSGANANMKRGKYTGEKIKNRKQKQIERQKHIQAIRNGELTEELPEPIVPELFRDIQDVYWKCLKTIPDPRKSTQVVYPLYLILHRIISGFINGNKYIGVLFPKKRAKIEEGKKRLGGIPTRKAVYTLLRKIDWVEANSILAPLWERLGYTPNLIVKRKFRDPKEIINEFKLEQECIAREKVKKTKEAQEAKERSKGMSAAKAKQPNFKKANIDITEPDPSKIQSNDTQKTIAIQHDLVIDGKVVKASYNNGVKERYVHVTEIKQDENENKSRFIIGAQPTILNRHGEWGAALSILDALTPMSGDKVVIVSGDAGFCVEDFCNWLDAKGFFSFSE